AEVCGRPTLGQRWVVSQSISRAGHGRFSLRRCTDRDFSDKREIDRKTHSPDRGYFRDVRSAVGTRVLNKAMTADSKESQYVSAPAQKTVSRRSSALLRFQRRSSEPWPR